MRSNARHICLKLCVAFNIHVLICYVFMFMTFVSVEKWESTLVSCAYTAK